MKNKRLLGVFIMAAIVLVAGIIGTFYVLSRDNHNTIVYADKRIKHTNTDKLKLDFMEKDLIFRIDHGLAIAYYDSCKVDEATKHDKKPTIYETKKPVSSKSISIAIRKLKEANSYEETYADYLCPENYYHVTSIDENGNEFFDLVIFPDNQKHVLFVGLNEVGYSFYYDRHEDLNSFIRSLNVEKS